MATVKDIYALVVQADVAGGAAAIRQFATGAKKDLGDVSTSTQQMYATFQRGGAQVAAAGAAGLAALTAMGLSARKAAGDVLGLQRVSGGSAEEVSKLRFAAQQTGVDLDTLSTGLLRLSRNASTDKGATTLARYGIDARDAAGQVRPLGDLLRDVAGAVAALPNGAEKNDLVLSIFGRGGAALLPLLNRGAEGLDKLGVKAGEFGAVLDSKTLDAAKRYTAAQRDMNAAVDGLRTSIGSDVLPTLTAVNEAIAGVVSTGARRFEALPEGLRQAAVSGGLAVSALAAVGGTVASTLGSFGLAANGLAAAKGAVATMGGLGAAASTVAGPVALATVAVGGLVSALVQLNDQQREVIDIQAIDPSRIIQAGRVASAEARRAAADDVAAQLSRRQRVGPIDAGDRILDFVGLYGKAQENDNRAALAAKAIENVKGALDGLSATDGKRALDEIGAAMQRAGTSAGEVKSTLAPLYAQIGETGPVDEGAAAMDRYTKAVEAAAAKGVTLRQALDGIKDGVDPGELSVYADTLSSSLDPVKNLISANQRLTEAQAKVATSAKRDTSGIESAYKSLASAKQRLDDVLKGDGTDNRQVSPEVQIADARRRIVEANVTIALNPQDDKALTLRDEALADLDRAVNRRQQLNKEATQKEREVRDARQAVKDAEADVRDAKRKSDEDYAKAQRDATADVLAAAVDRKAAELKFADAILTGKLNVDEVSSQLQQLVDQGILPQSVKDAYVAKMQELVTQSGLAAAALQRFATGVPTPGPNGIPAGLPGSNVYGPPAPNTVPRSFIGPPAPGQTYQPRAIPGAPSATTAGPDPLGPIRSLPVKPYTDGENRLGVPAEVQRLLNAASWGALIDIMTKRKAKFPGFQYGGIVGGIGGTDSQLIRATPGEGVVNPAGMALLGARGLAALNSGRLPAASSGGHTYVTETVAPTFYMSTTDPDRAASRSVRKLEQTRRKSARRRAGVR